MAKCGWVLWTGAQILLGKEDSPRSYLSEGADGMLTSREDNRERGRFIEEDMPKGGEGGQQQQKQEEKRKE